MTLAPKKNGVVTDIPRGSLDTGASTPTTDGIPTVRNITSTYTTTISTPYIALYSLCGALGAEAIIIGALFGTGYLVLKASKKRKEESLKL